MKSTKIIFGLFILVAIAQLLVPTKMIYDQENTLKKGKAYKFITQPIDPSDPFRGKYIVLNYEISRYKTMDTTWVSNQEIFVYLKDSLGFAKIDTISKEKLNSEKDYLQTNVDWYNSYNKELNINIPFNRFYMEESKAKPAEDLVRNSTNLNELSTTYALVYVDGSNFVLNNVFVDDVPIKDAVDAQNKN